MKGTCLDVSAEQAAPLPPPPSVTARMTAERLRFVAASNAVRRSYAITTSAPASVKTSLTPVATNGYPPSFALKLGHKDMRLATELGRELGVPMRLANIAFAEMTEGLNRGWENRDSPSPTLLQLERCGLKVEVDPRRIQEVLDEIRCRMAVQSVRHPRLLVC